MEGVNMMSGKGDGVNESLKIGDVGVQDDQLWWIVTFTNQDSCAVTEIES